MYLIGTPEVLGGLGSNGNSRNDKDRTGDLALNYIVNLNVSKVNYCVALTCWLLNHEGFIVYRVCLMHSAISFSKGILTFLTKHLMVPFLLENVFTQKKNITSFRVVS